jgi:hypothetical protein
MNPAITPASSSDPNTASKPASALNRERASASDLMTSPLLGMDVDISKEGFREPVMLSITCR